MEYLGTLNNRLKTLINKILARLLGSKFEPDNIIKSKAKNFIIKKKILPNYKQQWKPIISVVKNTLQIKIQMSE